MAIVATFVVVLIMNKFYKWHYKERIESYKECNDTLQIMKHELSDSLVNLRSELKQKMSESEILSLDKLELKNKLESSEIKSSKISTEYNEVKTKLKIFLKLIEAKNLLDSTELCKKEAEISMYAQVSLQKSMLLLLVTSEETTVNGVKINRLVEQITNIDGLLEDTIDTSRDEKFNLEMSIIQSKMDKIIEQENNNQLK